jgi:hypothetical protein
MHLCPPIAFSRAIKYDPETQEASLVHRSLVGYDFGERPPKWFSGAVASD